MKLSKPDRQMKKTISNIRWFIKTLYSEEKVLDKIKRYKHDWMINWLQSRLSDFRKNKKYFLENKDGNFDKRIARQIPEIMVLLNQED